MRAPNGMPSTRWVDIAWRVINSVQEDRVLLISAGVTFYGLLALFPAPAALIALFGLFANPVAINDQLAQLSGFLPAGALEIVADQIKRIAAHSGSTLSLAFGFGTNRFSLGRQRRPGRRDAIMAQRGNEGHGLPVIVRHLAFEEPAALAPTTQRRHVGLGPSLVERQSFKKKPCAPASRIDLTLRVDACAGGGIKVASTRGGWSSSTSKLRPASRSRRRLDWTRLR